MQLNVYLGLINKHMFTMAVLTFDYKISRCTNNHNYYN